MPTTSRQPQEVLDRIEELAERTHRSRAVCLRQAIERGLAQVEWEYELAQRATDARSGKVTTQPLADVVAELALDGDQPTGRQ